MNTFHKTYAIAEDNRNTVKKKIMSYLKIYEFYEVKSNKENLLIFKKMGGFFDGWKFNPLKWESEIEIKFLEQNNLSITYRNFGNGHITPYAFLPLYQTFFGNLISSFTDKNSHLDTNNEAITKAKRKSIFLLLLVSVGALVGGFLANYLQNEIDLYAIKVFGVSLGAFLTFKAINIFYQEKNQL